MPIHNPTYAQQAQEEMVDDIVKSERRAKGAWKEDPASAKQLNYIAKLGGTPDENMTKGSASQMIETLKRGERHRTQPSSPAAQLDHEKAERLKRGPSLADTDVAIGAARASHIRDTASMFGEDAAMAEELAWDLKDPDPYY